MNVRMVMQDNGEIFERRNMDASISHARKISECNRNLLCEQIEQMKCEFDEEIRKITNHLQDVKF